MAEYELKSLAPIEATDVTPTQIPQPMQMIDAAVRSGASMETLERLFALQERHEANEARKAYARALVAFRAENIVVGKDKLVDFTGNTGKRTSYRHATLGNILDLVCPALSRHGLSHQWFYAQAEGFMTVTCRLMHVDGHFEETSARGPYDDSGNKNAIQGVGSAASYLERYTFCALTGTVTADMDDDGNTSKQPQFITDNQADEITKILHDTDSDFVGFLKWAGVATVKDIGRKDFRRIMAALEAKAKKQRDEAADATA